MARNSNRNKNSGRQQRGDRSAESSSEASTSQAFMGGVHSVMALLEHQPDRVQKVFLSSQRNDDRMTDIENAAYAAGAAVGRAAPEELDQMAGDLTHQGVVALVEPQPVRGEGFLDELLTKLADSDENALLLVLDGVTDPHNLGACLRTADAAGVHAVLAPKDRAVGLNATVRKVACGAAETVPFVQVTNLARTLRELKDQGLWLLGTSDQADVELHGADFKGPTALIMGAEGKGMRRLTEEHCDVKLSIPMAGTVSSLNVSVATGVCLYEAVRQRSPVKGSGKGPAKGQVKG